MNILTELDDERVVSTLLRLRVELFTAARILVGAREDDFWKLIDDVQKIRPGTVARRAADERARAYQP